MSNMVKKMVFRTKLRLLDVKISAFEKAVVALMRSDATPEQIEEARNMLRRIEAHRDEVLFTAEKKGWFRHG